MGNLRFVLLAIVLSACVTIPKEVVLPLGDHFTVISGAKLHYLVAGNGPVCIVHPGGPGFNLEYMRMPSLENRLTLVYIDPVGSGASDRLANPTHYTFDRYADDIEGLRLHLGLKNVCLLGHSAGGFVAQVYALRYQDRLTALVLYGTSPTGGVAADLASNFKKFDGEPWYSDAVESFSTAFAAKSDEELTAKFKKVVGFYVHDYTSDKIRAADFLKNVACAIEPLKTGFAQELPKFDVRERLPEIKTPTLVIVGREDALASVKHSNMLHDGIPGSKLVIIEKSGHFAHFDQPQETAKAIGDFVSSQSK